MLLVCTQPPSKDRLLCFAKKNTESIYVSSTLSFYESLLKQAATSFGILAVIFDLIVPSTFSVLMWGIFYDNVFEAKLWLSPRSNFFQTTRQRSFNINRRSLNRDFLGTRRKSMPKLQQLQLYGYTNVAMETITKKETSGIKSLTILTKQSVRSVHLVQQTSIETFLLLLGDYCLILLTKRSCYFWNPQEGRAGEIGVLQCAIGIYWNPVKATIDLKVASSRCDE